ncbi:MAG: hypothetical protein OXF75_08380 [Acidimicrobiaceae bacterium]|nr:hypothetical protein [Acidimicrobiaceae bacterium]
MNGPIQSDHVEFLRNVRTFSDVCEYFVDELGWPLDASSLEDELSDITFDWHPSELGIPEQRLKDLNRFQQMRPLVTGQPWGVFFLEFGGPKLPRTQIRRLLLALVQQKRQSPTKWTWRLDDLLFVVLTGDGDSLEVHLLAFRGSTAQSADFLSLSWRPTQSPNAHLGRLRNELLPNLAWPKDDDTASWRTGWREAFKLPVGQAIKDSARLAERMAKTARDLRDQILEELVRERAREANGQGDSSSNIDTDLLAGGRTTSTPFSGLMGEIRSQLVGNVTRESFADMCAQTLVYGTLSSRVSNPEDFGSSPIFSTVPLGNPFLEAFFEQVHDQAVELDLPGSDLPQLAADLRVTNVEHILDQIGSTAKGGDPVIHFYEEFLKQYDSKMRADAGAFYTPQPAVEFIVRMVDEVLRSRFGLPLGIADDALWRDVAQRNGFEVPRGIDPNRRFVSMVDPATGTGTFLVEWLRRARKSFEESRDPVGWQKHLREHVLESMHAFELMLAPYTIAHLKVALELHDVGANDGDAAIQILLTDTLEHAARQGQFAIMSDPVAEEGERAAELKDNERFTVVVGNPPYDREQRSAGDTGRRKGGVVRHGTAGIEPLIKTVLEPMKAADLGHHLKNVYNDYVYFWRWAIWQATELPPGPGVVAFITASSYLDGISMGGVRDLLRNTFDELWIVDLGGEGRGARKEDNIFDIQTPVAIAVGVRTGMHCTGGCRVRYFRITGTRAEKLDHLCQLELDDISDEVSGVSLDRMVPRSESQYYDWPKITDLFPWIRSGCKLGRTWPISEVRVPLKHRWQELISVVPRIRNELFIDTKWGQKTTSQPLPLLSTGTKLPSVEHLDVGDEPEGYERYGYRSFNRQWIIADHRLIDRAGPDLWSVRGSKQVFLTSLTSTNLGQGPVLTATPYVPDLHHFRGSYGAKNIMPFYRDPSGRTPNVTQDLLTTLSKQLGAEVGAEDLIAYVYALGGTSAFSERFDDELAEAKGPIHVPITANSALFEQAVALGRDLLWWHNWGERFAPAAHSRLPEGQSKEITPVEDMPDAFHYDPETQRLTVGTGVFAPISPEAWDFEVSGLKVLRSWLSYRMKNRKGRKSSPLDDIRPTRWTQTNELLLVLSIIEHTIEVTPQATELLNEIVSGPLIPASDLPTPTPANRKSPKP